jgi:hypothetical protein
MNATVGTDYLFVIDTDEYAGNFEREMCAYLTGRVGDCGVGDDFAELFHKEVPNGDALFENVASVPDEEGGCCRPATVWPSENWLNDGYGHHFHKLNHNKAEVLSLYVRCVEEQQNKSIQDLQKIIVDIKAGKKVYDYTVEKVQKIIDAHEQTIAKAKALDIVPQHLAYNSVGIWFESKPTIEQTSLMKERAAKFAEAKREMGRLKDYAWELNIKVNLEGFRLITIKKTSTQETLPI